MKEKVIGIILVFVLLLTLGACSKDGAKGQDQLTSSDETTSSGGQSGAELRIGDAWTVVDEWTVVVNSVKETDDRNEFADEEPAAVYYVDYSYSNLGYEDSWGILDGLYISLDDSIVDSAGNEGYSYPNLVDNAPQAVPVGATYDARVCIGVDTPGEFKVTVYAYDSDDNLQSATFVIDPA